MDTTGQPPREPKPYTAPVLIVYGTVGTMTQSLSKSGVTKDTGPNNTKT